MMAYVPPAKQKKIFWLLIGLGFLAVLVGKLSGQDFVMGFGAALLLVGMVSVPLIRFKNRLRG